MVRLMNSHFKKIKKNCVIMSELCFYYFFRRDFSTLLAKKNALFISIFTGIVCICFFHTRAKFYLKKIPTSTFWSCAKKSDLVAGGWSVGRFPCMFVSWLDFCWEIWLYIFFNIVFIGNLDY